MQNHMKTCSKLLVREMQINITLSFHLTDCKLAKAEKNNNPKNRNHQFRRHTLIHCQWSYTLFQLFQTLIWIYARKWTKLFTFLDPACSPLDFRGIKERNRGSKYSLQHFFQQQKLSTKQEMTGNTMVCKYNGILLCNENISNSGKHGRTL